MADLNVITPKCPKCGKELDHLLVVYPALIPATMEIDPVRDEIYDKADDDFDFDECITDEVTAPCACPFCEEVLFLSGDIKGMDKFLRTGEYAPSNMDTEIPKCPNCARALDVIQRRRAVLYDWKPPEGWVEKRVRRDITSCGHCMQIIGPGTLEAAKMKEPSTI